MLWCTFNMTHYKISYTLKKEKIKTIERLHKFSWELKMRIICLWVLSGMIMLPDNTHTNICPITFSKNKSYATECVDYYFSTWRNIVPVFSKCRDNFFNSGK